MKPLNEHIYREVHPMPKLDTTLAHLTGAVTPVLFTKLDAIMGFGRSHLPKNLDCSLLL